MAGLSLRRWRCLPVLLLVGLITGSVRFALGRNIPDQGGFIVPDGTQDVQSQQLKQRRALIRSAPSSSDLAASQGGVDQNVVPEAANEEGNDVVLGETNSLREGDHENGTEAFEYQRREIPKNLSEFRHTMQERLKQERWWTKNFSTPLPQELRVLLGVLSCPDDGEVRSVLMDTWMKQPDVCILGHGQRCVVNVGFIVGNGTKGTTTLMRDGVVQLDAPDGHHCRGDRKTENFCGLRIKTTRWYTWAVREFAWATHVAQLDQDYFPHFSTTLTQLAKLTDQRQFLGRTIHGFSCDNDLDKIRQEAILGKIPMLNPKGKYRNKYYKKYCTLGDLLFLSRTLALEMTNSEEHFFFDLDMDKEDCYHQDQWVGHCVTEFVIQTKKRVETTFRNESENGKSFPLIR